MKIIGNGLLARGFKNIGFVQEGVLLFASGVSNSNEYRESEFTREFELLKSIHNEDYYIVYFSTVSVLDSSKFDSKYIKHKLQIEAFVKSNFNKYLILRLPNVIGDGGNKSNLINLLKNNLVQKRQIVVHSKASRYFLDVELIPLVTASLLKAVTTGTYNVTPKKCYSIHYVIKELSKIYQIDPIIIQKNIGETYEVHSDVEGVLERDLVNRINEPLSNILKKYK